MHKHLSNTLGSPKMEATSAPSQGGDPEANPIRERGGVKGGPGTG